MAQLTERETKAAPVGPLGGLAAAPPQTRFAALEVPMFRWYWILQWVSSTGDGMENVIRGYLVVQLVGLGAAPFWLGMTVFAHWVPFTLFSLYGGALADRYDNRKVQIVSQLLLFTAAALVAFTTLTGVITVQWIFILLLVHGFAGAIGNPARQTLIHSIVGKEKLLSAISLNSTAQQFSQVIGPAVAGFVFLFFGAGWGFFVNALTFLPILVFLFVVRVPVLHGRERQPVVEALREGVGFVRQRPLLGSLIAIETTTVVFLGHTFSSLLVVFAAERFPSIQLAYPFLLVASGLGAIGAALFLAYRHEPRRKGLFIAVTSIVEMLAILLLMLASDYAVAFALMLVVGAMTVLAQSLNNTTLQLSAPDRIRGRVMGAYSFGTQGLRVVNGPLLGGLATFFGVPLAVAGSAALVMLVLGGITIAFPQLRASDAIS
ncbi:MAG: MFS transporter [Chloroflexota bacterium]|nr:MFS transporter [Chloroflexota bacterium]MDE3193931.1 MFS transporter [Chloroflexota bacterium]